MTDDEFREILRNTSQLTGEDLWAVIQSRPRDDWDGGANWECKEELRDEFDDFLQRAFADVPSPPPLAHVDSLTSNYVLAIVDVDDSGNKIVRAYEAAYQSMIAAIITSIEESVLPTSESPDSDVEPEKVLAELERFRSSAVPPRFLD